MKIIYFLSFILISSLCQASVSIDFLPFQFQYRFEDTAAQSKEMVRYQSYGTALQVDSIRFGYDYSSHKTETGNSSLSLETKTNESLFSASYQIYDIENEELKLRLGLFAGAAFGLANAEVQTRLLGSSSVTSSSNRVLGLLGLVVCRWRFLLFETDLKVLNSKDFSPSSVFVTETKLGLSIEI